MNPERTPRSEAIVFGTFGSLKKDGNKSNALKRETVEKIAFGDFGVPKKRETVEKIASRHFRHPKKGAHKEMLRNTDILHVIGVAKCGMYTKKY